jgi:methylsterol monooxygenase
MAAELANALYHNATTFIVAASTLHTHELYPGLDATALNWLERLWMNWYSWFGNPILATGIMSFAMHEVSVGATVARPGLR